MLARALARPCAALARARVRSRVGPIHRHVTTHASASSNDADTSLVLFAATLRATERVAAMLASDAGRGDVLCLHGEVGAGKSALSRAYVRAVCGDPYVEVPSPTFLLQQVYDDHCGADTSTGPPPVHHFDLYRLTGPEDCDRLGLEESFTAASSLIEWAERLGERCPGERLDVYIEARAGVGEGATAREMGAVVVEVKTSEEDEDEDELEDEDADPAFVDRKPRVIRLVPRGEAWRRRVDALAAKLS
jgi:tRNA threonylcarbamoyl adenosine modification protein YjeE